MSLSSKKTKARILIAAGGTGGHLFPAQALAQELLEKDELKEVLFAGAGLTTNRYFHREKFPYQEVSSATPFRKSPAHLFKAIASLAKGIVKSFQLLNRFQPNMVVGFGSFHSFPLLAAALLKRIPIVLFESNSVAGKVNRFFSRWARISAVQFPEAANSLSGKIVEVKVPLWEKEKALQMTREDACHYFNLSPDELIFLVFGGSQGSNVITTAFCEAAARLKEGGKAFQVIHITGHTGNAEQTRMIYQRHGISACVKEFEQKMHLAWKAASLVICRAGAATLAEKIAFEVPGLLIPFARAADDHQRKNALFMQEHVEGAVCLIEQECTAERLLQEIEGLIDPQRLQQMRENIRHFKNHQHKNDLYTIVNQLLSHG